MPLFATVPANVLESAKRLPKRQETKLRNIEEDRTMLSQSSDERQEHSVVIDPDDPKVELWKKNPGRMDVRGIDTPPKGHKRTKVKSKTQKQANPIGIRSIRNR